MVPLLTFPTDTVMFLTQIHFNRLSSILCLLFLTVQLSLIPLLSFAVSVSLRGHSCSLCALCWIFRGRSVLGLSSDWYCRQFLTKKGEIKVDLGGVLCVFLLNDAVSAVLLCYGMPIEAGESLWESRLWLVRTGWQPWNTFLSLARGWFLSLYWLDNIRQCKKCKKATARI